MGVKLVCGCQAGLWVTSWFVGVKVASGMMI